MSDVTSNRETRRRESAADHLKRLQTEFKKSPDKAALSLAEAYLDSGRAKDALRILQKHANGSQVEHKVLMAQALFDTFDNDSARQELDAAAKLGGLDNSLRAQLLLGELAFEAGKSEDAKRHLQRVRKLDGGHRRAAELLRNLGESIEVPEDTAVDIPAGAEVPEVQGESPQTALRQIGIGLVVCAVAFTAYYLSTQRSHRIKNLAAEAAPLVKAADVASLKAAEDKYRQALEISASSDYALGGIAETYAMLWVDHGLTDYKAPAIDYTRRASDADIEKRERYAAEALVALGEGRYADIETLEKALAERGIAIPEKVHWVFGLAQRLQGKLKAGKENLRRAHESSSGSPEYATSLGNAYFEDDDARNAALYWSLAAKANSSYVPGAAAEIVARLRDKGSTRSQLWSDLKRLESFPPEHLGPRDLSAIARTRAELHYHAGAAAEAVAAANKGLEIEPDSPMFLELRGRAGLAEGKTDEALLSLLAAHTKIPGAAYYLYRYAEGARRAGKADAAIKALEAQGDAYTDDARFFVALGDAYRDKGDAAAATKAYDKALELQSSNADALLGRGLVAASQRQYDKATEWFEKAVNARSNFPEVYEAIGLMWVSQGALKEGNTQLEQADTLHRSRRTPVPQLRAFYAKVIAALNRAGGSIYVRAWVERDAAATKGE